jgi:hypothetical protein
VTVRLCSTGAVVSGALVEVEDLSGTPIGSGTTDGTGIVTVAIAAAGDHVITVSKAGQSTVSRVFSATCTANAVTISFGRAYQCQVRGCNGHNLSGAVVSVTLSGNTISGITDSGGIASIPVPSTGTYAVNIHHPGGRFADYNGTFPFLGCFVGDDGIKPLSANSSHKCVAWGNPLTAPAIPGRLCMFPYSTTLHLTCSLYGAVTLTWMATTPHGFSNQWYGSKTVTIPACDVCPSTSTLMEFFLYQSASHGTPIGGTMVNANGITAPGVKCPGGADIGSYSNAAVGIASSSDVVCPPSPIVTGHITGAPTARNGYCTNQTWTITE